jgi:hypothetical protein
MGSSAEPAQLSTVEVCVRSLVVFGFAILMVRLATRRFFSQAAPFDVILGVMLGAALSRTINGPSPMILAMACVIVLALVHRLAGSRSSLDRRHDEISQELAGGTAIGKPRRREERGLETGPQGRAWRPKGRPSGHPAAQ